MVTATAIILEIIMKDQLIVIESQEDILYATIMLKVSKFPAAKTDL